MICLCTNIQVILKLTIKFLFLFKIYYGFIYNNYDGNYCFAIYSPQFIVFFFKNAHQLSNRVKKQCTVTALPIIKKL